MGRVRLDKLLVERGLADTRQRAQALIRSGVVLVNDVPKDKPGSQVDSVASVRLKSNPLPYVSRGRPGLVFGRSIRTGCCRPWGQHRGLHRLLAATRCAARIRHRRWLWTAGMVPETGLAGGGHGTHQRPPSRIAS